MALNQFLKKLNDFPETIEFQETMAVIDGLYQFSPTAFKNGELENEAGQNNGSCKIFAFGKLQGLTEPQTLACFGAFYRDDVLKNPDGDDHQNIRNFIKSGWVGIAFAREALTPQ